MNHLFDTLRTSLAKQAETRNSVSALHLQPYMLNTTTFSFGSGRVRLRGLRVQSFGFKGFFSLLPSKDKPALQGNSAEQSKDHMTALVAACYGHLQCLSQCLD